MKKHIARALLVAVTLVAACGDQYSTPTTPSTSTDGDSVQGPAYSQTAKTGSAINAAAR